MNDVNDWYTDHFGFEPADLAANRMGQPSPRQVAAFGSAARSARKQPPIVMLVLVVLIGGCFTFLATQTSAPKDQVLLGGGASAVMVGIIGLISMRNYRMANKMDDLQVLATQGRPRHWSIGNDGNASKLQVGDVKFSMFTDDAERFDETRVYRIYYAHIGVGTPAILSMEVVG